MNDASLRSGSPSDEAEARLVRLNGQVAAMRAVLVQLLQEVVVAEARLDHGEASLLLKANEQLIVSALAAQTDAEVADSAGGAPDGSPRAGGPDPSTGLPNRTVLLDRFELAIAHAKRHGNRVALLFLNLDAFEQIDDTPGHASADRARQRVAAQTMTAALASYGEFDGHPLRLRASLGSVVHPQDGEDARTLIAFADAALHLAKQQALEAAAPHPEPQHVEQAQRQTDLRDANESLILAALGVQELLTAAAEVRRRQTELLALVANELSDPYAPIRLAASTLGIPGAEAALLPRVQVVIDEQAERLAQMVRQVLAQQGRETD